MIPENILPKKSLVCVATTDFNRREENEKIEVGKMKRKGCMVLVLAIFAGMFIYVLNPVTLAESEEGKDAYFTDVNYATKIYANKPDTWSFTMYNENCAANEEGKAWFFLKFYIDGELWWNEYNDTDYRTWQLNKGHTVTHKYNIEGWDGTRPSVHDVKVKLYWYHNSTWYLEDTESFSVVIVLLTSMNHLIPFSYLVVYLIACSGLLYYYYTTGTEPEI